MRALGLKEELLGDDLTWPVVSTQRENVGHVWAAIAPGKARESFLVREVLHFPVSRSVQSVL